MRSAIDRNPHASLVVLRAVFGLALPFFVAACALGSSGCIYSRILYFNTPTLAAPSYFDNRPVAASTKAALPVVAPAEAAFALSEGEKAKYGSFDEMLRRNDTRAFLVFHDDAVAYERYFGGVSATTRLPSFSISKTFASALIGCALEDRILPSLDDRIVSYVTELSPKSHYDEITLDELLRMTSGIDFNEESTAGAALYYSTDLRGMIYSYPVKWSPGTHYLYGSVNIQLLWDALHRRLEGRTVADYFEKRFWDPIGAEYPAAWSLDSAANGVEKFFGGFSATARDQARLGLLFLHGGTLNGRPIVKKEWIERSLAPDPIAGTVKTADGLVKRGHYQWFLTLDGRAYFAKGYHGQYIFVVPDKNAVFVRFGEGYGDVDWPPLFERLADSL